MATGEHRDLDHDDGATATRAGTLSRGSDGDDFTTIRARGEITTPVVSGHAASDEQVVGLVTARARDAEYFAHVANPYGWM